MRFDSATASRVRRARRILPLAAVVAALAVAGCSQPKEERPGKTVLSTRKGENSIQVVEKDVAGQQVVLVRANFQGEENVIELNIDEPVYEVEIPLSLEQVVPPGARARTQGQAGQFEDLLIAQYLEKAQQLMLEGDYNGALRQINLVLLTKPEHVQAHSMKGSVYYAMGNYQLANEEWEYVLSLDPTNEEVQNFMDFLHNRRATPRPPLPGTPREQGTGAGTAPPPPPQGQGSGAPPEKAGQGGG